MSDITTYHRGQRNFGTGYEMIDQIEALEAKLAKAVSWFETIRDRAKGDYMANTYYLDALAALATIEGEKT